MRVPILMYHRVGDAHNAWEQKYCVSPERFRRHMQRLARDGWRAISLTHFFDWLEARAPLPERPFLLTFDDGFLGIHTHAAEVLTQLRWPAAVFLVSALTGQTDLWGARHNPSGATYPLLDASQINELAACGFDFQSHTRSHADLPTLDDAELRRELQDSRLELASLLGKPVDYLAYPYGHLDARVIDFTRDAGYRAAFSVQPGFNRPDVDRYRLRRLDVFGTDTATQLARKMRLGTNDGSLANGLRYQISRVRARLGLQ